MHQETVQRLYTAVRSGDLYLIRELLAAIRHEPMFKSELTECLHIGIKAKQVEATRLLLTCGAEVMVALERGQRAIHVAAQQNDCVELLRLVVRAGSSINVADDTGAVALHYALQNDDQAAVLYLLQEGAHLIRPRVFASGEGPMHYAARYTKTDLIMRSMIAKGGDVNAVSTVEKFTPLHLAVKERHYSLVHLLCNAGARVDAQDRHGNTPLHHATKMTSYEMVKILLQHHASLDVGNASLLRPLHVVCGMHPTTDSKLDIAQLLLEHGAHLAAGDNNGATPLHHAATAGNLRMAEFLLKQGAPIDTVDECSGCTPLNAAITANELECASMLITHGADVNLPDHSLMSPLHKVQTVPTMDALKYRLTNQLLCCGAKVNARAMRGHTPLDSCVFHLVIGEVAKSSLRRLVEAGAHLKPNPDPNRAIRNSPLCWLTWHGGLDMAEYLVRCGWNMAFERWIYLPGKDPQTNELLTWLRQVASEPRPLKLLCRNAIRSHLNRCLFDSDIASSLKLLPLPSLIIKYLSLESER